MRDAALLLILKLLDRLDIINKAEPVFDEYKNILLCWCGSDWSPKP